MKKFLRHILVILAVGLFLMGCSMEGEDTSSAGTDQGGAETTEGAVSEKVGFSISTLNNPFFVSMADGAEAKAEELGLELTVVDAGDDPAKQVTDIEDLIASGIGVLIVNPVDSASVAPVIGEAKSQGIKVIAVDRGVDGEEVDTFIGTDNVAASQQAGEYLLDHVEANAEVAILEGTPGASSAIERNEGALQALDGQVEIVSSQTANYNRDEGMTVTENILQANPNVQAIVAANDEMALGAIEAIRSAGLVPGEDILVVGFDATDDGLQAVLDGTMLVTVEQKPFAMGEQAVEIAQTMVDGGDYDAEVPVEVTLVDQEIAQSR